MSSRSIRENANLISGGKGRTLLHRPVTQQYAPQSFRGIDCDLPLTCEISIGNQEVAHQGHGTISSSVILVNFN